MSMQFFWDISRKVDYPRAMNEFEISQQMFVMMSKTLPGAIWTQAYSEPFKYLRWSVLA